MTRGGKWLSLLLLGLGTGFSAQSSEPARLMTDVEMKLLDRGNAMWRLMKVTEEMPANLARLQAAGYPAEEVAAFQPRLVELWDVPVDRNFGWLHDDTIQRLQEIDRRFVVLMRAARLYETTGIRSVQFSGSADTVSRLWRGAILQVLDYDEVSEFRLMNSVAAQDESRRVEGLTLTPDELRTLFMWRREYEGKQAPGLNRSGGMPDWQKEAQLDQCRRIRDLLGDERFAVYLGRANQNFEHMRQALAQIGETRPTVALDLWWLRQTDGRARDQEVRTPKKDEMTAQLKTKAAALLGEARMTDYLGNEDAHWLVIPVRQSKRLVPSQSAGSTEAKLAKP